MAIDENKQKALAAALGQIEKQFGKGSIMRLGEDRSMDVETISTGSLSLDIALGAGGLPMGRIVEIYGPESSGKTTLTLQVIAAAPIGLGLPGNEVLWMLMMAVIGFGVMVPVAGLLADAFGRRKSMVVITTLIILFALFAFKPLLGSGNPLLVFAFLLIGLSLMGLTFGPMGALLPELFPTEVRYTGASFSYNVSSILGASVAPYIAAWLQGNYGLPAVGLYLAAMAALTMIALLLTHETRHQSL